MPGDGVYKSTDAGKTWTHVGFADAPVHLEDPHPSDQSGHRLRRGVRPDGAPSEERGVFKSTDGGKTWKRVLFRDDKTGARRHLRSTASNPNVMYAALWEAYRLEYQMSSGGPGSGLFKSTDGGETWNEITRNPGLPAGVDRQDRRRRCRAPIRTASTRSSRTRTAASSARTMRGATWTLVNDGRNIRQRAFYYTHVFADPKNKDLVYVDERRHCSSRPTAARR